MANGTNKCIFIGNVGKDPAIGATNGGKTTAGFSMAVNETWKDADGNKKESVEWPRFVAFGPLADIIKQYVKKGDKLFIEAKYKLNEWTDENGNEKRSASFIIREMNMLGSKGGGSGSHNPLDEAGPLSDDDAPQF